MGWKGKLHTALLSNLPYSSIVYYRCGEKNVEGAAVFSEWFNFTTVPATGAEAPSSLPVTFAMYVDALLSFYRPNALEG